MANKNSNLPYPDAPMKDALNSTAVGRAPDHKGGQIGDPSPSLPQAPASDREGFANRKLIRPSLPPRERSDRSDRGAGSVSTSKKAAPPEQTHAENFYYQKQMQGRTMMVVVLKDGEEIRGVIEWYDRDCIKLNRTGTQPNLLIYKPSIKYLFKEGENGKGR
jgi:sRNA-binding regulator protein Hfq